MNLRISQIFHYPLDTSVKKIFADGLGQQMESLTNLVRPQKSSTVVDTAVIPCPVHPPPCKMAALG